MKSLPLSRPRGQRRGAPLEALSRTEKIIAFCRVLLATGTLTVVVVDPSQPSYRPELGHLVLGSYVAFSVLLFLAVRGEYVRQEAVGRYSVAADIVWIALISVFTERGTSPFFLLHVFVLLSVSVRWGLAVTAPVTVLLAALYPATIFVANAFDPGEFVFHRTHLFRPVYLVVLGYLIGYLGEHERRSKRRMGFMLDLPAAFRRSRPPGPGIARLMRRALGQFDAERAILVLRDPQSGRYFTWEVRNPQGRGRVSLRITEADPFPFPFTTATESFIANDLRPGLGTALCYDVRTGAMVRKAIAPELRLPGDGTAQALLGAPVLLQRELRGRALVVRDRSRSKFTRDDLEFLLLLVGQAAAGFEAIRLQENAEEVAVLEERARIARDLHDGFIQSLAGIDLRVEACKMLLDRDPSRIPRELEDLHQAVDRGYREVRHYLTVLRTQARPGNDLCATLERLAAEFSIREGVRVHLARPTADPGIPAGTAYEITQIVREALRNAVRHGQATQAVVKLGSRPSHLYLVIRDNGRGFQDPSHPMDADGFLPTASAPWSIRERSAALGGSLRVWSQPGRGSEITLLLPVAAQSGRRRTERRMHA
jgi:signal transduction histidine kinase